LTVVAPEHRPTLREELAPLPPAARWAVLGGLVVLLLGIVVALLGSDSTAAGERIVRDGSIAFNLRVAPGMSQLTPGPGELLHLERKGQDSMIVEPLELPAYKGDVGGILPVVASRELDGLKERFPGLELVDEGKTRINQVVGYTLAFRVSRTPRMYGRLTLLPQPTPGARDGVKLLMLASPSGGAAKASDVGSSGRLKTPYRSFRFGTEGP
jgi:hypothetical protein